MSLHVPFNSSLPLSTTWSGFLADPWSAYIPETLPPYSKLFLLTLVNVPVVVVILNVLWQSVSCLRVFFLFIGCLNQSNIAQIIPKDPSAPPVVFHWFPIIGSTISYGTDPLNFFFRCREKVCGECPLKFPTKCQSIILIFNSMATSSRSFCWVVGSLLRLELRETTLFLEARPDISMPRMLTQSVHLTFEALDSVLTTVQHLTTPVFGKDVVYDVPNEVFMEQKKFVKVGLSMENFRAYVGMIEEEVEDYINTDPSFDTFQDTFTNEWGRFDATDVMAEITILTASRTLQGKEIRSNLDKGFASLYTDLDGGFTPINFLFPNLPLESYRKRDRAHQKMSEFYVNIIKKRKSLGDDVSFGL
jgi:sterol 14alpha-demethylase